MKVFISSVIVGFEAFRGAAAEAVRTLGHQPTTAEDFPASSATPQQACLAGVRAADIVVLLLGERYGAVQASGVSATHEEFREARDAKPVLAFVRSNVQREQAQDGLLREVQDWQGGVFTGTFGTREELVRALTRALHDHEVSQAAGRFDEAEALSRARDTVESLIRASQGASLVITVASGPRRQVVRPAELESENLLQAIQQKSLFGPTAVLDPARGAASRITGQTLWVGQDEAAVGVDQLGTVTVLQPATAPRDPIGGPMLAIIDEDVSHKIGRALLLAAEVLDQCDPQTRLTDVVPVAGLGHAHWLAWRTREEERRSPNSASIGFNRQEGVVVTLAPPSRRRAALRMQRIEVVEDLTSMLRRERRQ